MWFLENTEPTEANKIRDFIKSEKDETKDKSELVLNYLIKNKYRESIDNIRKRGMRVMWQAKNLQQ